MVVWSGCLLAMTQVLKPADLPLISLMPFHILPAHHPSLVLPAIVSHQKPVWTGDSLLPPMRAAICNCFLGLTHVPGSGLLHPQSHPELLSPIRHERSHCCLCPRKLTCLSSTHCQASCTTCVKDSEAPSTTEAKCPVLSPQRIFIWVCQNYCAY